MGKKNNPPPSGDEPKKNSAGLMVCPNFGTCQTWVLPAKRGLEHKYGYYDHDADEIKYKTCPGG